MKIPKQLQNKSFRFIKIKTGTKKPAESDWTMSNNYKFNDPDFVLYLKTAKSYGIVCGFGKLAIIDCDNDIAAKRLTTMLPKTYTVRSPGHKAPHLYYLIKDLTEKIIMTDNEGIHYGEVQFTGAQALGANSLHPKGGIYEIVEDVPIAIITKKELIEAIKPFIKKSKKGKYHSSGTNMDISPIAKQLKGMDEKNGELVGCHPIHGSEGGANFRINEEKNTWFCFRCEHGGDALDLVAILEGIIECEPSEDWQNHFTGSAENKAKFKQTIKIAVEKYGYVDSKNVEKIKQQELVRPLTREEKVRLKNPNLLFNIIQEIQKEGVVGEEAAMLVLINRVSMRCVKNITKTSGNIIVSDNTGLGKDNITEKLCKVMLVSDKTLFSATCISDKALNYWHPGFEGASWDGRVMYLQDPEIDTLKGQAFRVRASGDNQNVTLDTERKLQQIKIEGKPILIVTSMNAEIDVELMRRWDSVSMDASPALTRAIIKYQLNCANGTVKVVKDEILRNAVRNLPRVKVDIPYALELLELIPVENSTMRTQNPKFLDTIRASAALHQFQRERNSYGEVVANKDDMMYAIFIINWCDILSGQALTRRQTELLEYLKNDGGLVPLKKIVEDNPGMSESWIYREEKDLVERRLIQMVKELDTPTGRFVKCYKIDLTFKVLIKVPKNIKGYFSTQLEKDIDESRKKHNLGKVKLWESAARVEEK